MSRETPRLRHEVENVNARARAASVTSETRSLITILGALSQACPEPGRRVPGRSANLMLEISALRPQRYIHQPDHDRHIDQRSDHGREGRPAFDAKRCDRDRDCKLEVVRRRGERE